MQEKRLEPAIGSMVLCYYWDVTFKDNEKMMDAEVLEPQMFRVCGTLKALDDFRAVICSEEAFCCDEDEELNAFYIIPRGCIDSIDVVKFDE